MIAEKEAVTGKVQAFYTSLPFNYHGSKQQATHILLSQNQVEVYADLHAVLKKASPGARILDVGCGAGWFANSVARHYNLHVTGMDLCETALSRAREVSREVGVEKRSEFHSLDLFNESPPGWPFFVVNSIGVLHHTFDCREALKRIARWVEEGGYLHVGLYHRYGRQPFLDLFKPYREKIDAASAGDRAQREQEAYALYKELNPKITDEVFLTSWFKDQVLHPHETQHTAEELVGWLKEAGFQPLSTSINRFQRVGDWRWIFEEEKQLAEVSRRRNCVEKRYFPGFFTLLAKRGPA